MSEFAPEGVPAPCRAAYTSGRKAQGVFVPASLFEKRATLTTTTPELIGTDHRADQFIAPFRDALLARRLGVRVLSGLRGNISIPKYGTGLSVGWVAENQAVPESNLDMDSITLSPKHAGGVTELSRQLIQQSSPDVEQLVRDDFAYMLAKAIDSALIKGGGANEPKGVMSTAGIQTANLATLSWANVSAMIGKLEAVNANVASSAWLVAPAAAGALRTTLKSASAGANYLLQRRSPGRAAGVRHQSSPDRGHRAGQERRHPGRLVASDAGHLV